MNGDRTLRPTEPIKDGDRLTVTLVMKDGYWSVPGGTSVIHDRYARTMRLAGQVVRPAPSIVFFPGDVIVLKHNSYDSTEYTHVRGRSRFLGDTVAGPTDAEVSRAFAEGRARLIARNGVALPGPITKDNLHLLPTINTPF